jgi:N-acetylglutamate synthase/N-acetylornithine aminotransferase
VKNWFQTFFKWVNLYRYNLEDARLIARTIVASSLVKAAVFGHDPNWGRLACAAVGLYKLNAVNT